MANDLNQCNFIGRVGKDPEVRYAASGTAVGNFSIAVGYKYKDTESTEWVRIVVFGKLAEIVGEYVTRGKQLFVSGRMQTRSWEDKDGAKRYTTEIIANDVQFLGSRNDSQGNYKPQESKPPEPDNEDMPF